MPEEKPTFTSSIPDHLLADLSPKDKYIIEQLSIMSQQQTWQVKKLENLDERVAFANSKTSKVIQDIELLNIKSLEYKKIEKDVMDMVEKKRFVYKYLLNKKFLIILAIFCLGLVKIMFSPSALEWFNHLVS